MKKCVYNVIIGDYDTLMEIPVITPDWDYICFTDNPNLKSKTWDIRIVENVGNLENRKFSRSIWRRPHIFLKDYDISISIGGQSYPNCNLDKFINKFLPDDIDLVLHDRGIRKGTYHEAQKCISKKKDNPDTIRAQMNRYRKAGLPEDTGIFSGGVIIQRHNNPGAPEHFDKWWEEIEKGSYRDQLSLTYVLWKYNLVRVAKFPQDILRGSGNYFQKQPHKGKKK